MGAVWFRFRAELRRRWRAWLGLALVAGVAAGAVIALAAGARRTDSAYPRYLEAQNAADLIFPFTSGSREQADRYFDDIVARPEVAESARAGFGTETGGLSLTPLDGRFGRDLNRLDVVEGRLPDPDRPEEVALSAASAEVRNLHVGDPLAVVDAAVLGALEDEGDPLARRLLGLDPFNTVRVVGIVTAPLTFPPQSVVRCCVFHSRAFGAFESSGFALAVRLDDGATGSDFLDVLERRNDGHTVGAIPVEAQSVEVQRSIHVQAVGLWLLAGLAALVAMLIVGQLLSRLVFLEAADYETLEALGMSRHQRIGIAAIRAGAVGGAAALVAVAVAVGLSPLFPTGLASVAEPHQGLAVDAAALLVGAVATVGLVVALSALPAWLASMPGARRESGATRRPSRLLSALTRSGAPVPALEGARMAVTRGRGPTAVPVGWSLGAISVGIAVLVAALTFAASLQHLLDTPRLYGVGWDVQLGGSYATGDGGRLAPAVARRPDVLGLAVGRTDFAVEARGEEFGLVGLDSVKGDVLPPALEGRLPTARREVALGTQTMERIDAAIGDTVDLTPRGRTDAKPFTVVGRTVLPNTTDGALLDRGALVSVAGFASLAGGSASDSASDLFVDVAPGTDLDAFAVEIENDACRLSSGESCELHVLVYPPPPDLVTFGRSGSLPIAMGAVFALLAAGTLVHVVVTSVRRRRRDLALLRTLGFVRRQLVLAVASSATVVVVIGLVVGIPIGLIAGRWLWTLRAESLGVFVDPRAPVVSVALVGVAAVVVANLIGFGSGRTAARAPAAEVLRAE